jgi:hypothetical protein
MCAANPIPVVEIMFFKILRYFLFKIIFLYF